jgi:hypothetical protein
MRLQGYVVPDKRRLNIDDKISNLSKYMEMMNKTKSEAQNEIEEKDNDDMNSDEENIDETEDKELNEENQDNTDKIENKDHVQEENKDDAKNNASNDYVEEAKSLLSPKK